MAVEINELVTLLYRYSGRISGTEVLEIYQMLVKLFYIPVFNNLIFTLDHLMVNTAPALAHTVKNIMNVLKKHLTESGFSKSTI